MKQLIIIAALVLGTGAASAQNFTSIPKCEDCSKGEYVVYGKWQCGKDQGKTYMMYHFESGVYKMNTAMQILKRLLADNKLSFESPSGRDVYLSSLVDGWSDLSMLDLTIETGSSYVSMVWDVVASNGDIIHIFLQMNEESRGIAIIFPR